LTTCSLNWWSVMLLMVTTIKNPMMIPMVIPAMIPLTMVALMRRSE
jgi:hypothetical protein